MRPILVELTQVCSYAITFVVKPKLEQCSITIGICNGEIHDIDPTLNDETFQ